MVSKKLSGKYIKVIVVIENKWNLESSDSEATSEGPRFQSSEDVKTSEGPDLLPEDQFISTYKN